MSAIKSNNNENNKRLRRIPQPLPRRQKSFRAYLARLQHRLERVFSLLHPNNRHSRLRPAHTAQLFNLLIRQKESERNQHQAAHGLPESYVPLAGKRRAVGE